MRKRIVCAGVFDVLDGGMVEYLKRAKGLSDNAELVVLVATDENAIMRKGKSPINSEETRLRNVENLGFVDEVVLGEHGSRQAISGISRLKPDVVALGYDQWADEGWLDKVLREKGFAVQIVRLDKYPEDFSLTA
jgi:FAD synthetase